MNRLPIRVKLALPFAVGMALLVAAMGIFIYVRVGNSLPGSADQALSAQINEIAHHAEDGEPLIDEDHRGEPTIAQVELRNGTLVNNTATGLGPMLDGATLKSAFAGPIRRTRHVSGLEGEWRLAAIPISAQGTPAVLVVGQSLAGREETLHHLLREFLFVAPALLLLTLLAAYGLATAALRPVEAMRRRAAAITAATPGQRLPVPAAKDELSSLALTLNEMLTRLEAAFEHERRFVADASHELRTPLALLRTELEVALRRPRSREELEAAVRSAAEETERLVRLSEDLLLIARADEGALPIRRELTAATELLERVRSRFAARAESLGRQLRVDPVDGLVVDADPVRIEQALGNLVDNALHHGAGTITLSARRGGGKVELHVADEGAGFPPEFAARAFDRFTRADEARSERGTGLGLSIVELIARAHGGSAHISGNDVWLQV
ncbi:MAG TPA: ATP-binding protein [Gaiellaceae bacterium]|nr:ATP-binding protein [Gaiellaceae bacterium]